MLTFFTMLEAPRLWHGFLGVFRPSTVAAPGAGRQRVHPLGHRLHAGELPDLGDRRRGLGVTLAILGVPFALLLGAFVALVDLLPLVGGLLAGVPVVVIAAIHSVPAGIVMLIVFLAYQQVENHILNPIIMSRTVRLNPFWVLLAVLVGATLGGRVGSDLGTFVGALIGIPVGGALQVVVREIRRGPDAIAGPRAAAPPRRAGRYPRMSRVRPLVIIPTYNEAENIERILRRIAESLPEAGVLVVDDGSPDGTGDLVKAVAAELPDVHLMARTDKSGLGSAYRAGFAWGLAEGYDALIEMDADFSHDPAVLPAIAGAAERGLRPVHRVALREGRRHPQLGPPPPPALPGRQPLRLGGARAATWPTRPPASGPTRPASCASSTST